MRDLADIREEIDSVDKGILELFLKRMELACQVAEYKISTGKKVYDKKREEEKLDKLSSFVSDDFYVQAVRELYTQIMSISRKKQFAILRDNGFCFDSGFKRVDDFDFSNATFSRRSLSAKVQTIYGSKPNTFLSLMPCTIVYL